jgi:hypothetical protein
VSEKTWHPYTEPPDNIRQVMLRFDPEGNRDCQGVYAREFGSYASIETNAWRLLFLHPTHWRELTEEEK